MLNWSEKFNIFCFLDSHNYIDEHSRFQWTLATMPVREFQLGLNDPLERIDEFIDEKRGWLFGHLGFQLQQQVYSISNERPASIPFGSAFLFEPGIIIRLTIDNRLFIYSALGNEEEIKQEIEQSAEEQEMHGSELSYLTIRSQHTKESYAEKIQQIKGYIQRGDFYEINYCYEFSGHAKLDLLKTLYKLSNASPNPFGAYYKVNDQYCFCASPERFLQKIGNTIISQPIKGTIKRDLLNPLADAHLKEAFSHDEKNRSENIMVVDLVRNDLSKIALKNSVEAVQLCEVKTYPNVHHLVSTVKAALKPGYSFSEILKATFPMGSMTGAPKKKVLEVTSLLEATDRGLYSGCIGYLNPDGDFDFNVVIRSLFYNNKEELFSFWVGGGITGNSIAAEEYDETLTKGAAIIELLKAD